MKNFRLNQNKRSGKNISWISIVNIVLSVAFILSLGVRFYYSDKASTAGSHLAEYEHQISYYENENEYLRNQYLTMTSLSVMKPLALENGYVAANIEYYTSPELASR